MCPVAQVVRDAVDRMVGDVERDACWQRALGVIGAFEPVPGEPSDLSTNHDRYLDDAFSA